MSTTLSQSGVNDFPSGWEIPPELLEPVEFLDYQTLIENHFEVGDLKGNGSYGYVYAAIDKKTHKRVALKVGMRKDDLENEHHIYNKLFYYSDNVPGVPKPIFYEILDGTPVMAMDLLGPSLREILKAQGGKLSLKSVLMVGIQILDRLQSIHSRGVVHLDLKPHNLLTGLDDPHRIYLIDFGLSKENIDLITKRHVGRKFISGTGVYGTTRYASLNAHMGIVLTRRDDLQSLVFTLVELRSGLPWKHVKGSSTEDTNRKTFEMKSSTSVPDLCRDFPLPMREFVQYVMNLEFSEFPAYSYLTNLLQSALKEEGFKNDADFDWIDNEYVSERTKVK